MKKQFLLLLTVVAIFMMVVPSIAAINIVVFNFSTTAIEGYECDALTQKLRSELGNYDRFSIIDKDLVNKLLAEQGLQMSGCVENACAINAGRIVGADKLITGRIDKLEDKYTITINLADIKEGRLITSLSEECSNCSLTELNDYIIPNLAAKLGGNSYGIWQGHYNNGVTTYNEYCAYLEKREERKGYLIILGSMSFAVTALIFLVLFLK